MKKFFFRPWWGLLLACCVFPGRLVAATDMVAFDDYFLDQTLRVDYCHAGNAAEELITLDNLYRQGRWAGNPHQTIDPFPYGPYIVKVYDAAEKKLIFSRGFASYFDEFRTTASALQGIKRTFAESVLIPFPKVRILLMIEGRDRRAGNRGRLIFQREIDPQRDLIRTEPLDREVKIIEVQHSGDPQRKIDLTFIAEGYSVVEEDKFRRDLERMGGLFFGQEPFRSHKERFNINGLFKPSPDSGCDEPGLGIFKRTAVDASFDSLGLDRYVLTEADRKLQDIAAAVPSDFLVIMVNHGRYGGGGIYRQFCAFTVDSGVADYLLLHEFGHAFAGLADEYYTSSVTYNDFYPAGIEPLEPNITALLDAPAGLKWRDLASPGIPLPTPWLKAEYEKREQEYQQQRRQLEERISALKKQGGAVEEIERLQKQAERMTREQPARVANFWRKNKYWGKVGAFEGAGYSTKGLYRPMLDCLMFSRGFKPYCAVCEQALMRAIRFYSE